HLLHHHHSRYRIPVERIPAGLRFEEVGSSVLDIRRGPMLEEVIPKRVKRRRSPLLLRQRRDFVYRSEVSQHADFVSRQRSIVDADLVDASVEPVLRSAARTDPQGLALRAAL